MEPSDFILVRSVDYFVVYPDGRKCSVTRESVAEFGHTWEEEGVLVETHVKVENVPIYGTQVLVP